MSLLDGDLPTFGQIQCIVVMDSIVFRNVYLTPMWMIQLGLMYIHGENKETRK